MGGPLSLSDVERIAALAQLELTDDEKHLFAKQLAGILAYAEQVQQLDTTGVPATAHVAPRLRTGQPAAEPAGRDDEPRPSLPVTDALANAPDPAHDGGFFKVPRVIGG